MKINIKTHLLQEGVVDHLKRNWGKYTTGAAAAGLSGLYAAGQGALGVEAQDAVQDFGEYTAHDLENAAVKNTMQGYKDAAVEVYSRPDNLIGTTGEHTLDTQNLIQKEHYLAAAQNGLAKGLRGITSMSEEPGSSNFAIRHPLDYTSMKATELKNTVQPLFTRVH